MSNMRDAVWCVQLADNSGTVPADVKTTVSFLLSSNTYVKVSIYNHINYVQI